jgi:hypothetical protein
MELSQLFDLMGELQLYGMKAARIVGECWRLREEKIPRAGARVRRIDGSPAAATVSVYTGSGVAKRPRLVSPHQHCDSISWRSPRPLRREDNRGRLLMRR